EAERVNVLSSSQLGAETHRGDETEREEGEETEEEEEEEAVPELIPVVVAVSGPPLSGVAERAETLSTSLGLPLLPLTDVVPEDLLSASPEIKEYASEHALWKANKYTYLSPEERAQQADAPAKKAGKAGSKKGPAKGEPAENIPQPNPYLSAVFLEAVTRVMTEALSKRVEELSEGFVLVGLSDTGILPSPSATLSALSGALSLVYKRDNSDATPEADKMIEGEFLTAGEREREAQNQCTSVHPEYRLCVLSVPVAPAECRENALAIAQAEADAVSLSLATMAEERERERCATLEDEDAFARLSEAEQERIVQGRLRHKLETAQLKQRLRSLNKVVSVAQRALQRESESQQQEAEKEEREREASVAEGTGASRPSSAVGATTLSLGREAERSVVLDTLGKRINAIVSDKASLLQGVENLNTELLGAVKARLRAIAEREYLAEQELESKKEKETGKKTTARGKKGDKDKEIDESLLNMPSIPETPAALTLSEAEAEADVTDTLPAAWVSELNGARQHLLALKLESERPKIVDYVVVPTPGTPGYSSVLPVTAPKRASTTRSSRSASQAAPKVTPMTKPVSFGTLLRRDTPTLLPCALPYAEGAVDRQGTLAAVLATSVKAKEERERESQDKGKKGKGRTSRGPTPGAEEQQELEQEAYLAKCKLEEGPTEFVIPAHSTVPFAVRFRSSESVDENARDTEKERELVFETVGCPARFATRIPVKCSVTRPSVSVAIKGSTLAPAETPTVDARALQGETEAAKAKPGLPLADGESPTGGIDDNTVELAGYSFRVLRPGIPRPPAVTEAYYKGLADKEREEAAHAAKAQGKESARGGKGAKGRASSLALEADAEGEAETDAVDKEVQRLQGELIDSTKFSAELIEQTLGCAGSRVASLRVTNNSILPAHVSLSLLGHKGPGEQRSATPKTPSKSARKPPVAEADGDSSDVFDVCPKSLIVMPGESASALVSCFPSGEGKYSSVLSVATTEAQTLLIPLSVTGATPRVAATAPVAEGKEVPERPTSAAKGKGKGKAAKGGKPPKDAEEEGEEETVQLTLARLPTGSVGETVLELSNPSSLPVRWSLTGEAGKVVPTNPPAPAKTPRPGFGATTRAERDKAPEPGADGVKWVSLPESEGGAGTNIVTVTPATGVLRPNATSSVAFSYNALSEEESAVSVGLVVSRLFPRSSLPAIEDGVTLSEEVVDQLKEVTESVSAPCQKIPVSFTGEAFQVGVSVATPAPTAVSPAICELSSDVSDKCMNFGTVLVGTEHERLLVLSNTSIHRVNYKVVFGQRHSSYLQCVAVPEDPDAKKKDPKGKGGAEETAPVLFSEGTIEQPDEKTNEPGSATVNIRFSPTEALFLGSKSVCSVLFTDSETGVLLARVPVKVFAAAEFSQFIVSPQRGVSFGPLASGSVAERQFEIINTGRFPFAFNTLSLADAKTTPPPLPDVVAQAMLSKDEPVAKGKGKDAEEPEDPLSEEGTGSLEVARFVVSPANVLLQPGTDKRISVTFHSSMDSDTDQKLEEVVVFRVSGRDASIRAGPAVKDLSSPEITFLLSGSSWVPAIENRSFGAIFEEQVVLPSLGSAAGLTSTFGISEQSLKMKGVLVGETIVERIKLINPSPVAVTFCAEVEEQASTETPQGKKGAPAGVPETVECPFSVSPATLELGPEESAYVDLSFKPVSLLPVFGTFKAYVKGSAHDKAHVAAMEEAQEMEKKAAKGKAKGDKGEAPEPTPVSSAFSARQLLSVGVIAHGILPRVGVAVTGVDVEDQETETALFRRVSVGNTKTATVTITNVGSVPASYAAQIVSASTDGGLPTASAFTLRGPSNATLPPAPSAEEGQTTQATGSDAVLYIDYSPSRASKSDRSRLLVRTHNNAFEQIEIALDGSAFEALLDVTTSDPIPVKLALASEALTAMGLEATLTGDTEEKDPLPLCNAESGVAALREEQEPKDDENGCISTNVFLEDAVLPASSSGSLSYTTITLTNSSNRHCRFSFLTEEEREREAERVQAGPEDDSEGEREAEVDWEDLVCPGLRVSPAVGHIPAASSKEISVAFTGTQELCFLGNSLPVRVCPIQYGRDRQGDSLSSGWDSALRTVTFVDGQRKNERVAEPPVEESGTPEFYSLRLFGSCASAAGRPLTEADSTVVSMGKESDDANVDERPGAAGALVPFATTPVLQKRSVTLHLANRSPLCLPVHLSLFNRSDFADVGLDTYFSPSVDTLVLKAPASAVSELYKACFANTGKAAKGGKAAKAPKPSKAKAGDTGDSESTELALVYAPLQPGQHQCVLTGSIGPRPLTSGSESDAQKERDSVIPPIHLQGKAQLPLIHIEADPCDYLTAGRRDSQLPCPAEFAPHVMGAAVNRTQVIEISGRGLGLVSHGSLSVSNLTGTGYTLHLTRLDGSSPRIRGTQAKQGSLGAGEKAELKFSFTPDRKSMARKQEEAYFLIELPQFNVKVPILVVCHADEPHIELSESHVRIENVMLDKKPSSTSVTLFNRETIPFSFSVDRASLPAGLKLEPLDGTIPAKGQIPLLLTAQPTKVGQVNKSIRFNISRRSMPLYLNVKYRCYTLQVAAALLPVSDGASPIALTAKTDKTSPPTHLDLGSVHTLERITRVLRLSNQGNTPFQYSASLRIRLPDSRTRRILRDDVNLKQCRRHFSLTNTSGTVEPNGEPSDISLTFCGRDTVTIGPDVGFSLHVSITDGPQYEVLLSAKSAKPLLDLSWTRHAFGPAFLYTAGAPVATRQLLLKNCDSQSLAVELECASDVVSVDESASAILEPNESRTLTITFKPTQVRSYKETLTFVVNGLTRILCTVTGQGVPLLVHCGTRNVDLGAVPLGASGQKAVVKVIPVTNKAACVCPLKLLADSAATVPGLYLGMFNTADTDRVVRDGTRALAQIANQMQTGLTTEPTNAFLDGLPSSMDVPPNGTVSVIVFFRPYLRLDTFTESVSVLANGTIETPLFQVSGAALGLGVRLDVSRVSFGSVVMGAEVTRFIELANTGDVGTDFALESVGQILGRIIGKAHPFDITPTAGYLPPNGSISLAVRFRPASKTSYHLDNIRIAVPGYAEPLALECLGSGIKTPGVTEKLTFSCEVREEQVQTIRVNNATNVSYTVEPSLSGDAAFSVPQRLVLPPGGADLPVTFHPLRTTIHTPAAEEGEGEAEAEAAPDSQRGPATKRGQPKALTGSVFVPLSDGTAVVVELEGNSTEPGIAETLEASGPARSQLAIPISVRNWMSNTQRFRVTHEVESSVDKRALILSGPQQIDIPSLASRRYVLSLYSYAKAEVSVIVTFTAADQEYVRYKVNVAFSEPDVVSLIQLDTRCREEVAQSIRLSNPLDTALHVSAEWDNDALTVTPKAMDLAPRETRQVRVAYMPLVPSGPAATAGAPTASADTRLSFSVGVLGSETYTVRTSAAPALLCRKLALTTPLGSSVTRSVSLTSYGRATSLLTDPIEYTVSVETAASLKAAASASKGDTTARSKQSRGGKREKGGAAVASDADSLVLRDFSLPSATVSVPRCRAGEAGREFTVSVAYEPAALTASSGPTTAYLRVASPEGGAYTVPLSAVCTNPEPRGPITVPASGSGTPVPFRNVTHGVLSCVYRVDNSGFALSAAAEDVPARGTAQKLSVRYSAAGAGKGRASGRLVVVGTTADGETHTWTYYLRGSE
ncbi:hypothetical protein KIPB_000870, partial [Kipferlia bialata]